MDKRGFNTQDAMTYLGVRSRFFDTHIAPMLKGKGVRAGTSIIYERADLDAAWDRYKLEAGSERTSHGDNKAWDAQKRKTEFSSRRMAVTKSTRHTESGAFEAMVSSLEEKRKTISQAKSN